MPTPRKRLLALCLPPAMLSALDGSLTLHGQSSAYWAGDYSRANELSPTFHHLLAFHPFAFAAGGLAWIILFSSLILLLPPTIALMVSLAITTAHEFGASMWLLRAGPYGYQIVIGLYIGTAVIFALAIRLALHASVAESRAIIRRYILGRLALISALVILIVYLFLWPRKI